MGVLVARIELGEVKDKKVVEGSVEEVVRSLMMDVLELWDPKKSDLVVTKEKLSDIKPELSDYGDVDVYVISYDIEWKDENVVDRRFFVVVKDLGNASSEVVEELATLSKMSLAEFEKELKSI
jgi:hypothetical protein